MNKQTDDFLPDYKWIDIFKFYYWLLFRKYKKWKFKNIKINDEPDPFVENKDIVKVTFIGHATVLIQTHGLNILTDPIFSSFAGLSSFFSVKRMKNPGVTFEKLPKIDIILLSHDHYDHLDKPTLKKIIDRDDSTVIGGFGNYKLLKKLGFKSIYELRWWEEVLLDADLSITFVPARHTSSRLLPFLNSSLSGGFIIKINSYVIYFAGDTAFGPHFEEIQKKFSSIDLSLLPIGAYKPSNVLQSLHMGPKEALKAHEILKSKQSIAIHFGTFQLSDESMNEPVEVLYKHKKELNLNEDIFIALEEGKSLLLKKQ